MGQNRYDPAPPLTGAAQRLRCQSGRRSSGPRLLLPRDVTVILLCAARRMSSALTPRAALAVSGFAESGPLVCGPVVCGPVVCGPVVCGPVVSDWDIRLPFGEAREARCGPPVESGRCTWPPGNWPTRR